MLKLSFRGNEGTINAINNETNAGAASRHQSDKSSLAFGLHCKDCTTPTYTMGIIKMHCQVIMLIFAGIMSSWLRHKSYSLRARLDLAFATTC